MSTQPTPTPETRSTTDTPSTTDAREGATGAPATFAPDDDYRITWLFDSESDETPY